MTLDYYSEVEASFDFDEEAVARFVVEAVLSYEKFPYEAGVSILLTDEAEIHKLNLENRGIDSATDVLSFPMIDFFGVEGYEIDDMEDAFDPDSGEAMLGDIVLCYERILSQASEYGHSQKREFAFLIAHSMLHLLGYDHMDEAEREVMESRQREILDGIGIGR